MSSFLFMYGTKGGVGKSTIAVNIAYAIGRRAKRVGLVDLDLMGPNVANLVRGLPGSPPTMSGFRVQPGRYGDVEVSSLGFFVKPHEAPLLTGRYLEGALEQLLFHDVWQCYDYVVVDLPPGFSELHHSVFTRLVGEAVLITTPHLLSTQDLGRGIRLLNDLGVRVRGVVENMSHFPCAECGKLSRLFVSSDESPYGDLPILGRVPFAPAERGGTEDAVPLVLTGSGANAGFRETVSGIAERLMEGGTTG